MMSVPITTPSGPSHAWLFRGCSPSIHCRQRSVSESGNKPALDRTFHHAITRKNLTICTDVRWSMLSAAEPSTFTTRIHPPHRSLRAGFLSKRWKTKSITFSREPRASFALPTGAHALARPLACLCAGMSSQVSFITSAKKRPRAGRAALISR